MSGSVASSLVLALAWVLPAQEPHERAAHVSTRFLVAREFAPSERLQAPAHLAVVGDKIVLMDLGLDTIGLVFAHDGRRVAQFGVRGSRSGEFMRPVTVQPDLSASRSMWVLDGQLRRLTHLELIDHGSSVAVITDLVVPIPSAESVPIVSGGVTRNGEAVVSGFFPGRRFGRISVDAPAWVAVGPPPPGNDEDPEKVRQHAYQTSIAVHPESLMFVAVTRYSDRLEIFRTNGVQVAASTRLRRFEPVYSVLRTAKTAIMRPSPLIRYGYLSVTANRHGVFALYSGRTQQESRGRANGGALVEFYGWDGVRKETFTLSEDASAIAVDANGTRLLSIVHGPRPRIAEYVLPVAAAQ